MATMKELVEALEVIHGQICGLHLDDDEELRDKWRTADSLAALITRLKDKPEHHSGRGRERDGR